MAVFNDIRSIASMSRQEFETTCMAHTANAYLGDHISLCKVLTKYKMYVDTRDLGIAPHLIMDGYWESWLTQCLAEKVKPGFVCMDIGANLGYYSLLMAELCGHSGRTISVEPNPSMAKLLRFSEFIHGWNFNIVEKAIADKPGEAELTIPEGSFGGASLASEPGSPFAKNSRVNVAVTTVDDIVQELRLSKVDMIKIDVEGYEPQVFEGMKKTITNNPQLQLIIEYSPFAYKEAKKFSDFLFDHFTIYRIKDVDSTELIDKAGMQKLLELKDHTDLYLARK
ncbi:MAG TPA: FkbM family methyltransferase [Chitinophagaceae bacterium]